MTERLHFHFSLSCIGEGNGSPLQCSCLENPRDGGAWWAAVYGVARGRTRLQRRSSSSYMPQTSHQPTRRGSSWALLQRWQRRPRACSRLMPRPPPGLCPSSGIKGQGKIHCPPGPEQASSDPALPSLLGLAAEDWRCPGPQVLTCITSTEPRVTLTGAGKPISFLIDTGPLTLLCLPAPEKPRSPRSLLWGLTV